MRLLLDGFFSGDRRGARLARSLAAVFAAVGLVMPFGAGAQLWGAPPPAVNSPAFAVRAPLPGQFGYQETIKYIDDGMKYVDPYSRFFVSAAGELCFYAPPVSPQTIYDDHHSTWCLYPQTVSRVEALWNGSGGISEVRLWCRHAYPQCARRLDFPNPLGTLRWAANSITLRMIPYREERAAIENLVFLMGGSPAPSGMSTGLPAPWRY